ncbi:MAG: hypothetical protein M4579_004566 [Chaenotheca gracillima]|nr:MAG: hypothetical protein M4579_004566 [Chaenotheca gracillima]
MASAGPLVVDFRQCKKSQQEGIVTAIKRIEKKSFPVHEAFQFDIELRKRNTTLLYVPGVSATDGEVVAYLVYSRTRNATFLHKLCVTEGNRRQGLAMRLMQKMIDDLRRQGCFEVYLWVDEAREPARRFMLRFGTLAAIALSVATQTIASPTVSLPINSQVPPLAVVAQPFQFVFAESTFTTSSGDLSYSLSQAPSWLRLESDSRTFTGTPGIADEGSFQVVLTATDGSGPTDANATFIVTSDPNPRLVKPLADQLPAFGNASDASSLSFYPERAFDIKFSADTFSSAGGGLNYYAISPNNTPLPSWVTFDGASLSFSGTTPPLSALDTHPQSFGVKLIASSVLGFAGAEATFNLTVGAHQLAFKSTKSTVNVTEGEDLSLTNLRDQLTLDGSPVSPQDISSASVDKPDWVNFDSSSLSLTGKVPENAMPSNVTITATDIYGDIAGTIISIQVPSNLFTRSIGTLNATLGQDFSFNISDALSTPLNVKVTVDIDPSLSWLDFDSADITLQGKVPKSAKTGGFDVKVTAASTTNSDSDSQNLTINLRNDEAGQIPSSTSSASPSGTAAGATNGRRLSKGSIAAAVIVPIIFLIIMIFALIYCCRRRRQEQQEIEKETLEDETNWPEEPVQELWPEAERRQSHESDEPQRLPALNAILKEGFNWRFSKGSPKPSTEMERYKFSLSKNSPRPSPILPAPGPASNTAGIVHRRQRSKEATGLGLEPRIEQSPHRKVTAANKLLALYSTEWEDDEDTASSGQWESAEVDDDTSNDGDDHTSKKSDPRNEHPNRSSETINRSSSATEPSQAARAYAASNSFKAHGPPRSKTGRTPPGRGETLRRSQDTERNRLLRQVQGRSPFFGGSGRTSLRTSFYSKRSSQSRNFILQEDSPTLPLPTVHPDRRNTFFPSFFRDPSEQTIPEIDSPTPGARRSPHLPTVTTRVTARERPRSRNIGSRLSDTFTRLSRQLSTVSNRHQSTASSPTRAGVEAQVPTPRFDPRFVEYVDEHGERQWRAPGPADGEPNTSPWIGHDSHGNSFEYSDEQEIEYGLGIPSVMRDAQLREEEVSRAVEAAAAASAAAQRPPARASVTSSTTRGVPRLVEFRAKRPVSVDSGTPDRRTRESSRSGSYAFL